MRGVAGLQKIQNANKKILREKYGVSFSTEDAIYHGKCKSYSEGKPGISGENHIEQQE